MDRRAFLDQWFNEVWVKKNFDIIEERLSVDASVTGLTEEPQQDKAAFRQFAEAFCAQFEMTGHHINHFMEDGDWVSVHVTFKGVGAHSRKEATFNSQILIRFEGEQMIEGYNSIDFMSLFQQVGLLPGDLMAQSLRYSPDS